MNYVTNNDICYNPELDYIEVLNPNEIVGIPLEVFSHEKNKSRSV